MDRVKGKVAIVTGAGQGMGAAFATLLAKEGAKVVVTDINAAGAQNTVAQVKNAGGEAIFIKHDVTSEKDWENVMNKTMSEYGRLNILVNNAGIMYQKKIEETTLEQWHQMLGVNLDSVFLGTKHAVAPMRKSGGGSIVNISSIAGIIGTADDTSQYIAAKGGVRAFTKAAAIEFSKRAHDYNIRVNSVHPGPTYTDMIKNMPDEVKQYIIKLPVLQRFADPMEIANGVLFLASDESSYVTGAELVMDGGWTII